MSNKSVFSWTFCFFFFVFLFIACNKVQEEQPILKVAINAGPEGDAIKKLAPEYTKAKIAIVELPYSSLREQLVSTLGESSQDFDVVMIDDPWFPQLAPKLASITNVPDSLLKDIVTASLKLSKYPYGDGELRALPLVGNTQLLFYRSDILSKLGIKTVPDDWASLVTLVNNICNMKAFENGKQVYGYAIRGRSGAPIVTDFLPVYWSLGGKLVDDYGKPTMEAVNSNVLKRALRIYKDLQKASPPGAINFDWSEMTTAFTNGQAVFELNWPAGITLINSSIKTQTNKKGWDIALPPGRNNKSGTSMIGNWLLSVPLNSKNHNISKDFIVWILEQQERVASTGNPPTRISVFDKLAEKPGLEYFSTIRTALENSTPRARTKHWNQIEDIVSRAVSGFLTGTMEEDEADRLIKEEIGKLFSEGQ